MKIKTKSHYLTENKAKKLSTRKAKAMDWSIQNRAIRTGDKVIVIAGEHRGDIGTVLKRTSHRAVVQGINMCKKHVKATRDQPGRVMEFEKSLHISNISLHVEEK